jgi:hypothetical protein
MFKPEMLRGMLVQGSALAGLGVAALALRRLRTAPPHPIVVEECPELVQRFPDLATAASQLADLGDDAALRALVRKLASIVRLDAARGPTAQWSISRLSSEVVHDATRMCRAAPVASSDEVFRAALHCRDEVVPLLQGQLDDLLHNHLLARGT